MAGFRSSTIPSEFSSHSSMALGSRHLSAHPFEGYDQSMAHDEAHWFHCPGFTFYPTASVVDRLLMRWLRSGVADRLAIAIARRWTGRRRTN